MIPADQIPMLPAPVAQPAAAQDASPNQGVKLPTADESPVKSLAALREALDYDPATGQFRWRKDMGARAKAGALAGSTAGRGYRKIVVFGHRYPEHWLAWLFVHGRWPSEIDHINRNRSDNRVENLREATRSQNNINKAIHPRNTSGFRGVSFLPKRRKWVAQLRHEGRSKWIGYFDAPEDAAEAYARTRREMYGAFAEVAA